MKTDKRFFHGILTGALAFLALAASSAGVLSALVYPRLEEPEAFPRVTEEVELIVGTEEPAREKAVLPEYVEDALIDVDGESRRGVPLEAVRNIVIHYVANPGSTARQNRNYFNNPATDTSSHFIVGLEGEVLLCVPLDEKSSASNYRNADTISIEVCHPDETGKFNPVTYNRVVELCAWLCLTYRLPPETGLIRHYDITGKLCPKYFVENEDAWETFKSDVRAAMRDR